MIEPNMFVSGEHRWGYNGMEQDNEWKGAGNSLDFGARIYDSRSGRWLSRDPLESKYPSNSAYVFALNTPIQAKDPDGRVVIFINGQHSGDGGTAAYWDGWDKRVKQKIGDLSARYIDGAGDGWSNTFDFVDMNISYATSNDIPFFPLSIPSGVKVTVKATNLFLEQRKEAGRAQGFADAQSISAKMVEGETVKIVTHSMGTAFARGYVEGMKQWGDKNNVKFIFQYELDVNAFQGGDLPKSNLVELTQNKTGGLDGGGFFHFKTFTQMLKLNSVPTVAKIPGAEDITMPSDANKGHEVKGISTDNIKNQGNGGAEKTIEQGSNNEKPHK